MMSPIPILLPLAVSSMHRRWRSLPAGVPVVIGAFGIVLALFWIWMIIDCIGQSMPTWRQKLLWVSLVLLVPMAGAAVYWFTVRKPNDQRRAATL